MQQQPMPPRWKRLIISCFVVLNVLTIARANVPDCVGEYVTRWIEAYEKTSPATAYRIKNLGWRWRQYGYNAGIDNRWTMFGYQSRWNWWYDIRAIYSDGNSEHSVLLPLPNQSSRTLAQKQIFDLKERKFELNLYGNAVAREAYARYLARQYPTHEGMPIKSIRWYLGTQGILPPDEAIAKQSLYTEEVRLIHLNDFDVGIKQPQSHYVSTESETVAGD